MSTSIKHLESSVENQLTNQLINQLTKLILQNEPNYKIGEILVSAYNMNSYGNLIAFYRPKNKAKRTQNEPNFELKLGLFFQNKPNLTMFMNRYWLCFSPNIAVKWLTKYIKE